MTSTFAVAVAGILQILLRTSIFIRQHDDSCSKAPAISSWIFLVANLDLLLDTQIYPLRYMHLPYIIQVVVETVSAILLTEFGSFLVWLTMENMCCWGVRNGLLLMGVPMRIYNRWETIILGVTTVTLSLFILAFVLLATDHLHTIKKRSIRYARKMAEYARKARGYFKGGEKPAAKVTSKRNAERVQRCFQCMQNTCVCSDNESGFLQCHSPRKRRRRCRRDD